MHGVWGLALDILGIGATMGGRFDSMYIYNYPAHIELAAHYTKIEYMF